MNFFWSRPVWPPRAGCCWHSDGTAHPQPVPVVLSPARVFSLFRITASGVTSFVISVCAKAKANKGHGAQPSFPAVYKEFEELHHMVKKLCQDYIGSSRPRSQESLEINDDKVAESLGITEFLRKREALPDDSAPQHPSQEMDGEKLEAANGRKRERERGVVATGERLATVKKPRRAALPTEAPPCPAATSGCQKFRPSCATAANKGHENFPPCSGGGCGETTSGDNSTFPAAQQSPTAARSGSAGPALVCLGASEPALYAQLAEPRGSPPAQVSMVPGENLLEHTADQAAGPARGSRVSVALHHQLGE